MATAIAPLDPQIYFGSIDRTELIEEHVSLVRFLAARVGAKLPPGVEVDDLVGAGMLGLIDAAEKFDPSRGTRFRTYAERRIRGSILDHLRSLDWAPRSLRRRAREIDAAQDQLERDHGRAVATWEVAEYLDINIGELQTLVNDLNSVQMTSLQFFESDGDACDRLQAIPNAPEDSPFAVYERHELRQRLASAVDQLPEKERLVISLYYVEELTMKEIGTVIGVNESRVSQIHSKAVGRLRASLVFLAA